MELKFSVVVATHNRKAQLSNCLRSIESQTYPIHEIIVIDDASTDETGELIKQQFPLVKYYRFDQNKGPAAARNKGIFAAAGNIIAFTDDDCIVPKDWISQLAAGFSDYPDVVGVGGYQEAPQDVISINLVAKADHLMRIRRWKDKAYQNQTGGYEIPGLMTNNVAYHRNILIEVDGFDETFPVAAGEDADLKLRITQKGYLLLYLPLAVAHFRDYSIRTQWYISIRRGIGAYYFESKHFSSPTIFRILLRFVKATILLLRDLVSIQWGLAAIIFLTSAANSFGQFKTAIQRKS